MTVADQDRLMTADDLRKRWGLKSNDWIYAKVRDGTLPAIRLGRRVRFRESSIEEYESSLERENIKR